MRSPPPLTIKPNVASITAIDICYEPETIFAQVQTDKEKSNKISLDEIISYFKSITEDTKICKPPVSDNRANIDTVSKRTKKKKSKAARKQKDVDINSGNEALQNTEKDVLPNANDNMNDVNEKKI